MERPILFSAPMVRAILEGRKTLTRRICRDQQIRDQNAFAQPAYVAERPVMSRGKLVGHRQSIVRCPYGVPGDRLWVRESFWSYQASPRFFRSTLGGAAFEDEQLSAMTHNFTAYAADWGDTKPDGCKRWKPSIHMPRLLSRIVLEVTDVRVQRLQDISEDDAVAEGAELFAFGPEQTLTSGERGASSPYRGGFACLWDEINADRATWFSNPWVWALSFKPVEV